ncbi:cAMP-dependent protein kinase type 1-like [Clupea harengus]|uniref:cAMP-dependent protein kinase type 1-like n=1 Tax=Clupea harengus TaxID=7950 RepID=A0A6P8ERQ1_CLUHA|nr:cAMP-dependent protein kinase type 1-like [Clupea harengus]
MRIVLLGSRMNWKNSPGNIILGREELNTSGEIDECVKREGETAGRHITVVEAPGWIHNQTVVETLKRDKKQIVLSVSLCPPGPHAVLLVIYALHSFTETDRRAVQEHVELLGFGVWSHTIVLFICEDWLGSTTIEQHIQREGKALQWVVEKCGNRYHVVENNKSDGGQVTELLEKIEEMVARNSGGWSMGGRPNFREGLPDDYSRGDSGYDSAKSGLESELIKTFKQLSAAGSAKGFGQQKPPLRPEHRKAPCAERKVFERKVPFVDESTITVNYDECIGRGSYGTVYRGSYQGTPAAVKMIEIRDNPRTTNEFIIPWRLSHPNIVRMIAVARSETHVLIANQYIHGANLQEVLYKDTPIKLQDEDKLFVAVDIAMAVEYIHGKAIIHQDLKPANVMIAADNQKAYLTDWGLANLKETVSMTTGSRQSGALCGPLGGTPSYMARECLVKCKNCSTMSDMWSLGITLLEMFTNSQTWSNSSLQELRKLLYKKKPPLALTRLQPTLHDIVKPLIEYEPKSRMNAKDLVILLKSKVDLTKRYGYKW